MKTVAKISNKECIDIIQTLCGLTSAAITSENKDIKEYLLHDGVKHALKEIFKLSMKLSYNLYKE
jgi:hypothetical protein